jgi:hypothetical protein
LSPQTNHTNILLAIMSHRNEFFRAIPVDASSDASEALIANGDAEEEDHHRLEEKTLSRFKLCYLLLGLLVGFCVYSSILGGTLLVITEWGEDFVTKCKTDTFVYFCLFYGFFFSAIVFAILGFLRNFAAMTYSAIVGGSKELLEEILSDMDYGFVVGTLVGICLAWAVAAALFGMRVQTVHSRVVLLVAAINAWLVLYTWLQHTDVDVPHFDVDDHSFVRGALMSIDRPYDKLDPFGAIDFLHDKIGTTHVAHHVDSTIPHYKAEVATEAI